MILGLASPTYAGAMPAEGGLAWLLDRCGEMQAPIQLWYGSEDQSIPAEEHGRIAEAMTAAHKRYTMNVFPGVGHGYFCEERESYDEAATQESWDAMLALFRACTA